jgi:hypothetical protein
MKASVFVQKVLSLDCAVNLSRGDVGMAKHLLNGTEIGTSAQEMGGEAVPEDVRLYVFSDTGGRCPAFDHRPNGLS